MSTSNEKDLVSREVCDEITRHLEAAVAHLDVVPDCESGEDRLERFRAAQASLGEAIGVVRRCLGSSRGRGLESFGVDHVGSGAEAVEVPGLGQDAVVVPEEEHADPVVSDLGVGQDDPGREG